MASYKTKNTDQWAVVDPILHTRPDDAVVFGAPENVPRFVGSSVGLGLLQGNLKSLQANIARVHGNVLRRVGFFLRYIVGARLTEEERLSCSPAQFLSLCSSLASEKLVKFARVNPATTGKSKGSSKDELFSLLKVGGSAAADKKGAINWLRMGADEMKGPGSFIVLRPKTRKATAQCDNR